MDLWLTPLRGDEVFTTEMLASAADQWPRMVENCRDESPYSSAAFAERGRRARRDPRVKQPPDRPELPHLYPTRSLSSEI